MLTNSKRINDIVEDYEYNVSVVRSELLKSEKERFLLYTTYNVTSENVIKKELDKHIAKIEIRINKLKLSLEDKQVEAVNKLRSINK